MTDSKYLYIHALAWLLALSFVYFRVFCNAMARAPAYGTPVAPRSLIVRAHPNPETLHADPMFQT